MSGIMLASICMSGSVFKKINILGHFNPDLLKKIMKINNFRGDLPDISAEKEALICTALVPFPAGRHSQLLQWMTTSPM